MSADYSHLPVLAREVLQHLITDKDGIYVDGTFGRGGHSQAILEALSADGRLYAIDKDPEAIAYAHAKFAEEARFQIMHGSFAQLKQLMQEQVGEAKIAGIFLDLGVSSPQLDDAARGFSFLRDGPLDLRMNNTHGMDATTWLNQAAVSEIAWVLKEYGEERFAKRIANAIVREREKCTITRTLQLAEIVKQANPSWEKHKHPATRSFQAIRIFINQELEDLRQCLQDSVALLAPYGRLAVISFHSLEDRLVKRFFQKESRGDDFPVDMPVTQDQLNPTVKLIERAIKATPIEVQQNPRARSAVLRIAEKLK